MLSRLVGAVDTSTLSDGEDRLRCFELRHEAIGSRSLLLQHSFRTQAKFAELVRTVAVALDYAARKDRKNLFPPPIDKAEADDIIRLPLTELSNAICWRGRVNGARPKGLAAVFQFAL